MLRPRWTSPYGVARVALAAATGIACAAALALAPASAATDAAPLDRGDRLPRIHGVVGPGFDISVSVDSVPAGRYKLVVRDKSTIHNFHVVGAGVDEQTSVSQTGKQAFRVNLVAGKYKMVCDPHSDSMRTTLKVTA